MIEYAELITVCIPVHIDSAERMRNLRAVVRHLSSGGMNIHILETGEQSKYRPESNEESRIRYTFIQDCSTVYHKTKYVNILLQQADSPIVVIWDADIILPLSQIEDSAKAIHEEGYILSIPYNTIGKLLSEQETLAFEHSGDDCRFLTIRSDQYRLWLGRPTCGGIFVVNREAYLKCGGDNPHFISWGPEDAERVRRLKILGYPIHWSCKGPVYHMWHPRGENSGYSNDERSFNNRMEFIKVCNMNKQEVKRYITSWQPTFDLSTIQRIPTYIINLKKRIERKEHILAEFDGKPEFEPHIMEACQHKRGNVGLWNSIIRIIKEAKERDDAFVLICEDDHFFTENYSAVQLYKQMEEAQHQNADLLSGGITGFGQAIPVGHQRYWIDWFWATQFIIIYSRLFDRMLDYPFKENDTADGVLSLIASNKMVIHPFISEQRGFSYSDVTETNMQDYEQPRRLFNQANDKFNLIERISRTHNQYNKKFEH